MPRKLRLSVHRKNEFRKKRELAAATDREPSASLAVSIPRFTVSVMPVSLSVEHYRDGVVSSVAALRERMKSTIDLPEDWLEWPSNSEQLVLCKMEARNGGVCVGRGVVVDAELSWKVLYDGNEVRRNISVLSHIPPVVASVSDLEGLISAVDGSIVCGGNSDEKYQCLVHSRKGAFRDSYGEVRATYESQSLSTHTPTVRACNCEVLVSPNRSNERCQPCSDYRKTLNAMLHRHEGSTKDRSHPSSHVNYRYLTTPEKIERLHRLHTSKTLADQRIARLQSRIDSLTEVRGTAVDEALHSDLTQTVEENTAKIVGAYPPTAFQRVFWEQQQKACSLRDRRSMKWDPLMIRWCLYLRHLSSGAYETLRQSGVIVLPSQRTLRDYTHHTSATTGFSTDVDRHLIEVAQLESCPPLERNVFLIADEMHIKQDLVYDKHTGAVIGFTNLGDVNTQLEAFERSVDEEDVAEPLATSMLVFMVRGLFTKLEYPYAQFPCTALSGDQLYQPFWESVGRLERIGFHVLGLSCDGLSANRRFFQLHSKGSEVVYKVPNPHASDGRYLYFISDPPHLMKTVRNAWANKKRSLWCKGQEVSWAHLLALYERNRSALTPGLALLPKLKYEHIHLGGFSKMRVDLAAQVLSNSVAKALELTGGPEAQETARFVDKFNKFFDCMNVSSLSLGKLQRNAFKSPYRSGHDFRLKWLEDDFLVYLQEWKTSVYERPGFDTSTREKMLLSRETRLGLEITVRSFVELVRYIFTLPDVSVFLSNKICQDPLENFFGEQRQRGRVNENPNVQDFCKNTQALRVVNGTCRNVRGNCRGSTSGTTLLDENMSAPLMKRKRYHK